MSNDEEQDEEMEEFSDEQYREIFEFFECLINRARLNKKDRPMIWYGIRNVCAQRIGHALMHAKVPEKMEAVRKHDSREKTTGNVPA